jgi:RNA recognition motif-containing protein
VTPSHVTPHLTPHSSAFIKIDERYAERAVETVNNSYFFGKQIKVQYSNKNPHGASSQGDSLPSGLSGINACSPISGASGHSSRFVIDDFFQLSGQRPSGVILPRASDVDSLLARRKRLEVSLMSHTPTR